MRKSFSLVAVLALLCVGVVDDKPKHVTDAETLVTGISADKNAYQHKGCFIKWKGEDGAVDYENRSDCSDFLALLVEHSYGITPEQLKKWTGHARPLAEHWHDAIAAGKQFTQIAKLADAKVGDVLAIEFPPGLDDTGHVMLIVGQPESITAKAPIEPGTQQWNVPDQLIRAKAGTAPLTRAPNPITLLQMVSARVFFGSTPTTKARSPGIAGAMAPSQSSNLRAIGTWS